MWHFLGNFFSPISRLADRYPTRFRVILATTYLITVVIVSTLIFMRVEVEVEPKWANPQEAFFTTMLIVSTLGFTRLSPQTLPGELITILLMFSGIGVLTYLATIFVEGLLHDRPEERQKKRMDAQIAKLNQHYVVCGYGRVGRQVCQELIEESKPFVVVDSDPEEVAAVRAAGYLAIQGEASEDEVLKEAGVERAFSLMTSVGSDASNVYITLSARQLNPSIFIVARASTIEARNKLSIAGANRVVSPYTMGGRRMANLALRPTVMDFLDVVAYGNDIGLVMEEVPIEAGTSLDNKQILDINQLSTVRVNVLAVRHTNGTMLVLPSPETRIYGGETLIVLGTYEDAQELRNL